MDQELFDVPEHFIGQNVLIGAKALVQTPDGAGYMVSKAVKVISVHPTTVMIEQFGPGLFGPTTGAIAVHKSLIGFMAITTKVELAPPGSRIVRPA